jgi:vacuolar protein sorting-associated protein 33A
VIAISLGMLSKFHIYFIPHRTVACEQLLDDEDVLRHAEIGEFHMGFIPFDSDILSLEMDTVFKQCSVDGDTSSLNAVARALWRLQTIYGIIPNVKSKGLASKKIVQKLLHIRSEEDSHQGQERRPSPAIDTIVL